MFLNVMDHYGIFTRNEFFALTLEQYENMIYSIRKKEFDDDLARHVDAWTHYIVEGQKNVGTKDNPQYESLYPTFKDFYDMEANYNYIVKGVPLPARKEESESIDERADILSFNQRLANLQKRKRAQQTEREDGK